jgi:hypothetical protein
MNATATTTTPLAADKRRGSRGPKVPMALKLGALTPEIRRQAAAVLEVLAGVRTPTDAAKDLSLSLPAYYKLESRAVRGLIFACRPPGRGRVSSPELEANKLRRQCQRLTQDLQRYQALARSAQRAAGLPVHPAASPKDAKGRKKRKPVVRALKALAAMKQAPEAVEMPSVPSPSVAPVAPVSRPV